MCRRDFSRAAVSSPIGVLALETPPRNKGPFRLFFFKRQNRLCGHSCGGTQNMMLLRVLAWKETSLLVSPAAAVGVASLIRFDRGGIALGMKAMRDALLMGMDPDQKSALQARKTNTTTRHMIKTSTTGHDSLQGFKYITTTRIPRLDGVYNTCCA